MIRYVASARASTAAITATQIQISGVQSVGAAGAASTTGGVGASGIVGGSAAGTSVASSVDTAGRTARTAPAATATTSPPMHACSAFRASLPDMRDQKSMAPPRIVPAIPRAVHPQRTYERTTTN